MIRIEMHPVANEVEVSTDQVERYFLQWAKPGFTGQRKVFVRVLPEAGLKVEFIPTGNEVQRARSSENRTPENLFNGRLHEPTERETLVSVGIVQNRHRFRIGMRLTAVLGHFVDGKLTGFEWETIG